MVESKSILKVILSSRHQVVERAKAASASGEIIEKVEWHNRREFLDSLHDQFKERQGVPPYKRVFVSYSASSGMHYYKIAKKKLEEFGFDIRTGFDPAEGDKGMILSRILNQIRDSTVYLGILTKEMRVLDDLRGDQWVPSVWTIEEKGMALALSKPFVIMVHEDIHKDFWLKTLPHHVHWAFNDENFLDQLEDAAQGVVDRYEEAVLNYTHRPSPNPIIIQPD